MVELQDERLSIGKGQTINRIKFSLFAACEERLNENVKARIFCSAQMNPESI